MIYHYHALQQFCHLIGYNRGICLILFFDKPNFRVILPQIEHYLKNYVFDLTAGSNSKSKKVSFFRFRRGSRSRKESPSPDRRGASMQQQPSMEMVLRELTHPAHNDQLKNHQQVTFKLVITGKFILLRSSFQRILSSAITLA